jgi:hypothetical protein
MHNGLAINLTSTIDIYDKLVIAKGIFKKYVLMYIMLLQKKNNSNVFFFIFLHYISYEEPKRDLTLK